MNFKIENFGKVRIADIRLDGVTVITGENGSGKSTISRALTAFANYLNQADEWIAQEKIESLVDRIGNLCSEEGLPVRRLWALRASRNRETLAEKAFWENKAAVEEWVLSLLGPDPDEELQGPFRKVISKLYGRIVQEAEEVLSRPDGQYGNYVLQQCFRRAFGGQIGTLADGSLDSTVAFSPDKGNVARVVFRGGDVASSNSHHALETRPFFYVEPQHLMDHYDAIEGRPRLSRPWSYDRRYSIADRLSWTRIMLVDGEEDVLSYETAQRLKRINETLDGMVATIHGEIAKDEHGLRFRDTDIHKMVALSNIASGAKTMALLIRGLRNGVMPADAHIIIDEPETNLHPEWQVKFAQFLVLLHAQFGTRLLLNTHSPFFLKAILTYSDLAEVGEQCAYYNMEKAEGDVLYTAVPKNRESIESVFTDMARPYARLLYGDSYDEQHVFG